MLLQCPQCGKTYEVSDLPAGQALFRCTEPACKKIFPIPREGMPDVSAAAPEKPSAKPKKEVGFAPHEVAKSLAQDYFSDIPHLPAARVEIGQEEETPPELAAAQRAQLMYLAQTAASDAEETDEAEESEEAEASWQVFAHAARAPREKRIQQIVCWILQALAVILVAVRILITAQQSEIALFSRMQPQLIPSALYLCAALILIHRLVRRTTKPQWTAPVLLLPLILDGWYLLPASPGGLTNQSWLLFNCGVKLLFALFGLVMSIRSGKNPAKKYLKTEA